MAFGHPSPSAPPAPGTASGSARQVVPMQKLQAVLDRFEISIAEANDLTCLQDYRVVCILDDSGSMENSSEPVHLRSLGKPCKTRWQELQETMLAIIEITACVIGHGVTLHFLNRPSILDVRSASDSRVAASFAHPPCGGTPLAQTLKRVVQSANREHGLLLFIFTDGEPSDGRENFSGALRTVVKDCNAKVQIMACTNDDAVMEWLNQIDSDFHEVDVTDDYYTERDEVLRTGRAPRFTRGDWMVKALLGPICRKYDEWDEEVKGKEAQCGLCNIM